ncbi:NADH-quinone oxidoreductase subunit C [Candidatus Bathyarchaeota archaeon]|nr:NADH-quinone oxidoreductase subunit C [Candidatus Bathyarchaeota archaeon]
MNLINEVEANLEKLLGADLLAKHEKDKRRVYIRTSKNRVKDVANYFKSIQARLAHISVIDLGLDGFDVIYHYALDHLEQQLHFNIKVNVSREESELPSVTSETMEALWPEREMMDLMPVKFSGNPIKKHLWLPYEWPKPVESENVEKDEQENWVSLPTQSREIDGSTILVGPYHPLLLESCYFRFKVDGEEILDAEIKVGWNHRGIMKLFEDKSFQRGIFISERICGICSIAHTTAYCNAMENLWNLEIPDRAKYIRTFMDELERIHSHLLWLAVAGDLIGFETLFMLALKTREKIMDVFERLTGHRRNTACNLIGGVRVDPTLELLQKTERELQEVKKEVKLLMSMVQDHKVAQKRMENIGLLPLQIAKDVGAVGPTARGSGYKVDSRWSDPFAAYSSEYTTWDVVLEEGKDCWARTMVRLKELLVSLDISFQCIEALKKVKGPIVEKLGKPPEGESIGKNEAPRGELFYYVVSNGSNTPYSIRVRTPSYRNNSALPFMLKGYTLADAPIIIGSIDPCMSCTDRIVKVINEERSEEKQFTLKELARRWK